MRTFAMPTPTRPSSRRWGIWLGLGTGDWGLGEIENRNSKIETRKSSTEFPVSSFEFRTAIENRQSTIDHCQSPAPSPQHLVGGAFLCRLRFPAARGPQALFRPDLRGRDGTLEIPGGWQGRLGLTQQIGGAETSALGQQFPTGRPKVGATSRSEPEGKRSADPRFWGPRLLLLQPR